MKEKTESISLRLPVSLIHQLEQEADRRSLKRSQYVRSMITDALSQTPAADLSDQMEELRQGVEKLEDFFAHKLALVTVALLSDMNKDPQTGARLTQQEIKSFVKKNLYT